MTKLSVIIPTYNRAAFLRPCVESVRASGVVAEIVVVDDGSTDDTAERVREFGDVIYVRQANAGPAAARNNGLVHSRGPLVAFLDSDDTWRPGVVNRLVAALEQHSDGEVAFADALVGNPEDGWHSLRETALGKAEFEAIPSQVIEPGLRLLDQAAFFRRMVKRNQVFLGSAVIRRTALEELGGFDPDLFGGEDYELVLRLAQRRSFLYVEEALACYLKHEVSITSNRDRMDCEFALALQKILDRCSGLSSEERQLVRQRRRELLHYLAYNAFDRGDLALARQRLRALISEFGADTRTLTMLATCRLPVGMVRGLRRLRRSLTGARS